MTLGIRNVNPFFGGPQMGRFQAQGAYSGGAPSAFSAPAANPNYGLQMEAIRGLAGLAKPGSPSGSGPLARELPAGPAAPDLQMADWLKKRLNGQASPGYGLDQFQGGGQPAAGGLLDPRYWRD